MSSTKRLTLSPRTDDWEELTEFTEDLSGYVTDRAALYTTVQAIAEGKDATVVLAAERVDEFVAHMREFRIDVQAAKR